MRHTGMLAGLLGAALTDSGQPAGGWKHPRTTGPSKAAQAAHKRRKTKRKAARKARRTNRRKRR